MNYYAQPHKNRRSIGIAVVVVLHILFVWALVSGTALKTFKKGQSKVNVSVIEDTPPPPMPTKNIKDILEKTVQTPTTPPQVVKPEIPVSPPNSTPMVNSITAHTVENPVQSAKYTELDTQSKTLTASKKSSIAAACSRIVRPENPIEDEEDDARATINYTIEVNAKGTAALTNIKIVGAHQYQNKIRLAVARAVSGYKCDPNSILVGKIEFN